MGAAHLVWCFLACLTVATSALPDEPRSDQFAELDRFLDAYGIRRHRDTLVRLGYEDLSWYRRMPASEVEIMMDALSGSVPPGHLGKLRFAVNEIRSPHPQAGRTLAESGLAGGAAGLQLASETATARLIARDGALTLGVGATEAAQQLVLQEGPAESTFEGPLGVNSSCRIRGGLVVGAAAESLPQGRATRSCTS